MVQLNKHPILMDAYHLIQAIEEFPASELQTKVVTQASDLMMNIEKLIDSRPPKEPAFDREKAQVLNELVNGSPKEPQGSEQGIICPVCDGKADKCAYCHGTGKISHYGKQEIKNQIERADWFDDLVHRAVVKGKQIMIYEIEYDPHVMGHNNPSQYILIECNSLKELEEIFNREADKRNDDKKYCHGWEILNIKKMPKMIK